MYVVVVVVVVEELLHLEHFLDENIRDWLSIVDDGESLRTDAKQFDWTIDRSIQWRSYWREGRWNEGERERRQPVDFLQKILQFLNRSPSNNWTRTLAQIQSIGKKLISSTDEFAYRDGNIGRTSVDKLNETNSFALLIEIKMQKNVNEYENHDRSVRLTFDSNGNFQAIIAIVSSPPPNNSIVDLQLFPPENVPIEITFQHRNESNGEFVCVQRDELHWSPDACRLLTRNDTHSICSCQTSTSYALLLAHPKVDFHLWQWPDASPPVHLPSPFSSMQNHRFNDSPWSANSAARFPSAVWSSRSSFWFSFGSFVDQGEGERLDILILFQTTARCQRRFDGLPKDFPRKSSLLSAHRSIVVSVRHRSRPPESKTMTFASSSTFPLFSADSLSNDLHSVRLFSSRQLFVDVRWSVRIIHRHETNISARSNSSDRLRFLFVRLAAPHSYSNDDHSNWFQFIAHNTDVNSKRGNFERKKRFV